MSTLNPIYDDGGVGGKIGGGATPTPTPTPTPSVSPPPQTDGSGSLPAIVASAISSGVAIATSRIPLLPILAQVLSVQLGNQPCRIAVRQKSTGLFVDLYVNDRAVALGVLARDRVWMIRDAYLGFTGDLAFVDTQGGSDPDYTGLAERYQLIWGR